MKKETTFSNENELSKTIYVLFSGKCLIKNEKEMKERALNQMDFVYLKDSMYNKIVVGKERD